MELQAVMEKRRSIRNYNPERKVTKEQLEELIKAASYAPSWKNLQTSRYYCVLSENAVKELREKAKTFIKNEADDASLPEKLPVEVE